MSIKVKNAVGTSDDKAPEGNLERWKEFFGIQNPQCSQYGCFKKENTGDLVGAHIEVLEGEYRGRQYIVPLCRDLNSQHGEVFYIKDDISAMPVDELN